MATVNKKVDNSWLNRFLYDINILTEYLVAINLFVNDLYGEVANDKISSLSIFDEFESHVASLKRETSDFRKISSDLKTVFNNLRNRKRKSLDIKVFQRLNQIIVSKAPRIDKILSQMIKFLHDKRMMISDLTPQEATLIVDIISDINNNFGRLCIQHNSLVKKLNQL